MYNLIKMDLYRLLHSLSTWIVLSYTVILAIFSIAMINIDMDMMKRDPDRTTEQSEADIQLGIYVETNPEWVDGEIALGELMIMNIKSGMLAILCVIFAAIYANGDQKNGYIKNIAGQFSRRGMLVCSKFIAIALGIFVMMAVFGITEIVCAFVLWGKRCCFGAVLSTLKCLGIQYLLHLALSCVIMFFGILTYSTSFGMTTGILVCTGFAVPIYSLINRLIDSVLPKTDFYIGNYMVDRAITQISLTSTSDINARGIAIGAVFTIVSLALSVITIKKRDIR